MFSSGLSSLTDEKHFINSAVQFPLAFHYYGELVREPGRGDSMTCLHVLSMQTDDVRCSSIR